MVNIRDNITLKACRIIADIKAEELAQAVGVNTNTIYKWEKGRSFPDAKQMVRIILFFAQKGYLVNMDEIKFF